jgi:hypothetical protein
VYDEDFTRPEYKLTCKDFQHTGVQCCEECHDSEFADLHLRVVQIDGVNALLCCALIAFFYPRDPGRGQSPEERLLMAIFGEKIGHAAAEKYIDPVIYNPDYEPDF